MAPEFDITKLADGPQRQGEIIQQYDELRFAVNDVFDCIDLLEDRLVPILRKEPQAGLADKSVAEPAFSTDMGTLINEQVRKVRRIQQRLNYIKDRIEL
jgi:hypothetical protein